MLEPIDHQYFLIGYIARSQGVDGTVLIIPELYAPTLFDDIDLVRLKDARGDLIPARIESVQVQEKNDRLSFFVKFDHITDRNQAEMLKTNEVFVAREKVEHFIKDESTMEFASFEVQNEHGSIIGVVDEIMDNPGHAILAVSTDNGKLLIPFVDEYVSSIDEENAMIYCQNLHQLSNLG